VNPKLNAIVANRYETARVEAERVDELIENMSKEELNESSPFLGVPCTIKESIGLVRQPFTSGLWSRKGVFAQKDAGI
jgi:fatty acid amide hydrolase 2